MVERVWTISNTISMSRVLLVAPLGYCLLTEFEGNRLWAAGIILIGIVTDYLDGFLARRLHQVSEVGKIIDPLADKIGVGMLALFLVVSGDVPLWYFLVIIVRDAFILAGGIYIRRKKSIVTQSNWPGKIAVTGIALVLLLSTLRVPSLEDPRVILLWASVAVMVFSLAVYAQRLFIGRAVEREL